MYVIIHVELTGSESKCTKITISDLDVTQKPIYPESDWTSCISWKWYFPKVTLAPNQKVTQKLHCTNVTQQSVFPECDSTIGTPWMWLNYPYSLSVTQLAVFPECGTQMGKFDINVLRYM